MIKVDLVTGFLGSGKTTFIKEYAERLYNKGQKVAIIVNDYGAINVDRLLLEEKLGDKCRLEMVIGGDVDCARRRLKTKLIAMAMEKFDRVIVEPSGIFDVDEFFDMLYEEPLERMYEIGNVFSIVEAGLDRDMSHESRYFLASQITKAGCVVISKTDTVDGPDTLNSNKDFITEVLSEFNHRGKLPGFYLKSEGGITDEDFEKLLRVGYGHGDIMKLPLSEENGFKSLFFFHVKTPIDSLKEMVEGIFSDKEAGNVIRLKGFIQNSDGTWLEVNATKSEITIKSTSVGQELFIVIGEGLDEEKVGSHFEEYRNSL
ncbi:MAG: GTP-binding protein [Eubacterium sp.]|nr:GTP-binding protein [Eubacterium sp.]